MPSTRLTGLQRQVLRCYRNVIRVARVQPQEQRITLLKYARKEFDRCHQHVMSCCAVLHAEGSDPPAYGSYDSSDNDSYDLLNPLPALKESITEPCVGQVMNRQVVVLHDDMMVSEAIQILLGSGISGAPVLDRAGSLVGVLSETDIILEESESERAGSMEDSLPDRYAPFIHTGDFPITESNVVKVQQFLDLPVSQVMSSHTITISPKALVMEAAMTMAANRVNRLPVVDDGRVVGIITRGDVLQCMIWSMMVAARKQKQKE